MGAGTTHGSPGLANGGVVVKDGRVVYHVLPRPPIKKRPSQPSGSEWVAYIGMMLELDLKGWVS